MDTNIKKNKETNSDVFLYLCGGITVLGLIAAFLCYLIYGIIFLVEDYNTWHDCKNDSKLWVYVLVTIIMAWSKKEAKNITDYSNFLIEIMLMFFVELGMAIWGAIELFDKSQKTCCINTGSNSTYTHCDELYNTQLWKWALGTNCISWIFIGIILIFILVCYIIERRKDSVQINQITDI